MGSPLVSPRESSSPPPVPPMMTTPPNAVGSIDEARDWLLKRFRADLAGDVSALYRLELDGRGGGCLCLRVVDGVLQVAPAEEPADVVMRLAAEDFFRILDARANPDLLLLEDRLVIEGDLSLALKLRTLFRAAG